MVGVRLGVWVRVGVVLGLGEMVNVGDCVSVAVWLAVTVALGVFVQVGLGNDVVVRLQLVNKPAKSRLKINTQILCLGCNAEKRIMIVDLPVVDAKRIFSVAYVSLR